MGRIYRFIYAVEGDGWLNVLQKVRRVATFKNVHTNGYGLIKTFVYHPAVISSFFQLTILLFFYYLPNKRKEKINVINISL
jgi:hypothetical protein